MNKLDDARQDPQPRAADGVVAELESRILSGLLVDKQPLPSERELMEEFDISRTVVREAIATLSNRGLVESKPRFRPVVRKPDFDTIINATDTIIRNMLADPAGVLSLYESRIFIERGLVRQAATTATKEDISLLKQALEANKDAIDDSLEFFRTDLEFHRIFYDIGRNPIFPAIHKAYGSWLWPYWERMKRAPSRNERNYHAHKAIYDAILERDPDAAEQALASHLARAWEDVGLTMEVSVSLDRGASDD
ncbi:MAG: FCD domain-containing protein [Rhizobiaceae bacterium]